MANTTWIRILLVHLLVKNFGIIDEIDWSPGGGLNVLTGETGAGKSLIIDAISALLSGKLDESAIRHGTPESRIEGTFDISARNDLAEIITERGIDIEDSTLILSLVLKRGNRPVIRINGANVQRNFAREIGQKLVDIHGQSQHLSLLETSSHLDYLDAYAGTLTLRHEFCRLAQTLSGLVDEFTSISSREADLARQQDFLSFQYQEIERAALAEGEDARLEDERKILGSAEKLIALAKEAENLLDGEDNDNPATTSLSGAASALEKLTAIDDRLKPQADAVRNALFEISDTAREVRSYVSRVETDPSRLEEVEERLGLIRDLKRKYGNSISEILTFAEKTRRAIDSFNNLDDRKSVLLREIETCKRSLAELAANLSDKRQTAGIKLGQAVNTEFMDLGMETARFQVSIIKEETVKGLALPDGHVVKYDLTGTDRVEFFASTNPGESFQPLIKIASTGELSRFTLAVKASLASADRIPVLIFDEIDIGIGARSGDIIGRKLSKIALSHQVICITHLPQIACYGAHHFSVRKVFDGKRATSTLDELSGSELVTELALMLSGQESRAATEGALELVAKAALFTET